MTKTKTCSGCKLDLPVKKFTPHKGRLHGVASRCRQCCNSARSSSSVSDGQQGASYWLEKETKKKAFKRETQEAFEDAVSRPSAYELRNRGSGHGMPVDLGDSRFGVFWSKGWRGCEFNCGRRLDDWSVPMHWSMERAEGVVTWRLGCRKSFTIEEE